MVIYEWDVELVEIEGEGGEDIIVDHDFYQSYKEAKVSASAKPEDGHRYDMVLVRDDDKGREWAYMKDGRLPEYFNDAYGNEGTRVPKKFHKEVSNNS